MNRRLLKPATVSDEPVQLEQPAVANERVAAESIAADEPMLAMAEPSASQENFFPDRQNLLSKN
jgi:hypothetical protein